MAAGGGDKALKEFNEQFPSENWRSGLEGSASMMAEAIAFFLSSLKGERLMDWLLERAERRKGKKKVAPTGESSSGSKEERKKELTELEAKLVQLMRMGTAQSAVELTKKFEAAIASAGLFATEKAQLKSLLGQAGARKLTEEELRRVVLAEVRRMRVTSFFHEKGEAPMPAPSSPKAGVKRKTPSPAAGGALVLIPPSPPVAPPSGDEATEGVPLAKLAPKGQSARSSSPQPKKSKEGEQPKESKRHKGGK